MKKLSLLLSMAIVAFSACQQDSFKKGDDGLEYKIISSGSGDKLEYGNFMEMHVGQFYNNGKSDSVISDTRTGPQGAIIEPLDSNSMPPAYYKILSQLKKGDSLVLRILTDSAFKEAPQGMPPMFQKGHYLLTTVKLQNVYKDANAADNARKAVMAATQERMKAESQEQLKKDDKILTEYFAKNNIKVQKSPEGTYVEILQPGTGAQIDTTVVVKTMYTGKTMDGKTFDSNIDPAFNHTDPFLVNMTNDPAMGRGVIAGWTDGLKLLSKGAKARFYIPSALAYGSQGAGEDIKPNSNLIFDIEVLDILDKTRALAAQAEEQKKMQAMQKRFMDSMQKATPQPQEPGN